MRNLLIGRRVRSVGPVDDGSVKSGLNQVSSQMQRPRNAGTLGPGSRELAGIMAATRTLTIYVISNRAQKIQLRIVKTMRAEITY